MKLGKKEIKKRFVHFVHQIEYMDTWTAWTKPTHPSPLAEGLGVCRLVQGYNTT